jgi:hypothetical protein
LLDLPLNSGNLLAGLNQRLLEPVKFAGDFLGGDSAMRKAICARRANKYGTSADST